MIAGCGGLDSAWGGESRRSDPGVDDHGRVGSGIWRGIWIAGRMLDRKIAESGAIDHRSAFQGLEKLRRYLRGK